MIEKISEMKKALDEVLKNGISSMKCLSLIHILPRKESLSLQKHPGFS